MDSPARNMPVPKRGPVTLPILLYHSISSAASPLIRPFTVTGDIFRQHLDCVLELGYTSLTVSRLVQAVRGLAPLPDRPIAITFDDGFADFHDVALPALRERGLAATLYVTTGFLRGRASSQPIRSFDDPMLAWSQLSELQEQGIELGGHSHTHPHLDTLRRAAAWDEITRCKALLEEELGTPITSFAYPNGYSSPMVRRLVREAAYHSACSVKEALSSTEDDVFSLARMMVRSDTSAAELRRWVRGVARPMAPKREALRTRVWRLHRRARAIATGRPGTDLR